MITRNIKTIFRSLKSDFNCDRHFFMFVAIITIFYGLAFVFADFYGMPCEGMADYVQLFKYWLLIEIGVFGLFLLLSLQKWVFAVSFPLITFACTVMTYYRYTVKAVLTPQVIDLVLVNDMRTSMHAISWQLVVCCLISLLLSYFVVRYRWKKISVRLWYLWIVVALLFIYYPNSRGHLSTEVEQRMPYSIYYSIDEYLRTKQKIDEERDMFKNKATAESDSITVVFIIGESLRADHLQVNGYKRETTPMLLKEPNIVSLPNVRTDFTLTHLSIPHFMTRSSDDNPERAYHERSFISLFKQAGFHTSWLANQESGDTYVYFMKEADTLSYVNSSKSMYLFDSWLDGDILPIYDDILGKSSRQLIVMHTVGSHWFYNSHFTKEFCRYTPTADSRVINGNSVERMVNSYDNTILYSDWFWHEVIDRLRSKNAVIIYLSDHGESLGEDGYFTHGVDREEQHSVASWIWYSDRFAEKYPEKVDALKKNKDKKMKTYFLFHSIIDAGDLKWADKESEKSVFTAPVV